MQWLPLRCDGTSFAGVFFFGLFLKLVLVFVNSVQQCLLLRSPFLVARFMFCQSFLFFKLPV